MNPDPKLYYLLINLGSVSIPFLLSFDKRVAFYKKWRAFWPANLITLAFFVVWDVLFTHYGVWGFNGNYLTGVNLINLPIEEWLFFICVPYASVFLYETLRTYISGNPFDRLGAPVMATVVLTSAALFAFYTDRWYTAFTALFTLIGGSFVLRKRMAWMGWYAFAYAIVLVPFIVSNGMLTGLDFTQYPMFNSDVDAVSDQIVWYNNAHNLQLRIFSVPVDDFLYAFLLLGMNIAIYEALLKRYQLR